MRNTPPGKKPKARHSEKSHPQADEHGPQPAPASLPPPSGRRSLRRPSLRSPVPSQARATRPSLHASRCRAVPQKILRSRQSQTGQKLSRPPPKKAAPPSLSLLDEKGFHPHPPPPCRPRPGGSFGPAPAREIPTHSR